MKPHFTISANPAKISLRGRSSSTSRSADDGAWRIERTHEVLALCGVDACLAADGGVNHACDARRALNELHAPQPGRGYETGQIGRCSAAETDDGIRASEVGLAHDLPAKRGHFDALGVFGVRNLGQKNFVLLRERLAQCVRACTERRRVNDEHLRYSRAELFRKLRQAGHARSRTS